MGVGAGEGEGEGTTKGDPTDRSIKFPKASNLRSIGVSISTPAWTLVVIALTRQCARSGVNSSRFPYDA